MTEEILINFTPQETRVAVMQQGVVQELHIERTASRGLVGNVYLGRIQKAKQVPPSSLDEFLTSHVIPVAELRADDFDAFIRLRAGALLTLIEAATGKTVSGRDSEDTVNAFGAPLTP